ncbi:hypothetical protein EMIHUDRAFT_196508 [Emiliania huxleyi CCMP1516]|uniref:POPLD domain-containing protein n=2 Tax=Emiliania huxleyi TaxID=2903 RepID=A0A0D3J481_EMIH1|nr:hypothetical protein EMIHUDRAFT_196508 [Emiliania huxleyi CCMP1516]EOD18316.1 hypothetical protein EMIHUDRAFT_196508 [Emiliania huxleyi CCMP1516]|eukprot:XP_005770745.1 hypothetical protein EMIHUDRAFT_196508 [Emiliania huxleyi CCMP1516]
MSYLDPLDFAAERAAELKALESLLEPAGAALPEPPPRLHQRLSRRRAGSASARWKVRPPLSAERREAVRDRSRRDRRRTAVLRARTAARGGITTEAWHAKRFEMATLFRIARRYDGMRLPWRASDRAPSSAVRACAERCTIHDASYLRMLLLQGAGDGLLSVLGQVTDAPRAALRRLLGEGGAARELPCTLHQPGAWPLGAIAPVRLLCLAGGGEPLQLRGATSHALLTSALRTFGQRPDEQRPDEQRPEEQTAEAAARRAWSALQPLASPAALPARAVLSLRAHVAALADPPPGWGAFNALQCPSSTAPPAAAPSRSGASAAAAGLVQVVLVQQPACAPGGGVDLAPGYGAGWDLLLPTSCAAAAWHALVAGGGRAIGQAELRAIALHQRAALFPYDWPDTPAGRRLGLCPEGLCPRL